MLDVLDQHQPTARTVANLGASAVSAHLAAALTQGLLVRGARTPQLALADCTLNARHATMEC